MSVEFLFCFFCFCYMEKTGISGLWYDENRKKERRNIMEKQCLLKKFGILDVNKYVPYRKHPNPEFAYVYLDGGWHTVPKEDIEL